MGPRPHSKFGSTPGTAQLRVGAGPKGWGGLARGWGWGEGRRIGSVSQIQYDTYTLTLYTMYNEIRR